MNICIILFSGRRVRGNRLSRERDFRFERFLQATPDSFRSRARIQQFP